MNDLRRQFLLGLVGYTVNRGIAATVLCDAADLAVESLMTPGHAALTPEREQALWTEAARLTKDPLFGLHLGESLQLAALGTVGEIVKSSNAIGNAITVAASFVPAVTDLYTMDVSRTPDSFSMTLHPTALPRDKEYDQHVADFLMVFSIHELDGLLLKRIRPLHVRCVFDTTEAREYTRVLRTSPVADPGSRAIAFDASDWDVPILSANYEMQTMLLDKVRASNGALQPTTFRHAIETYLSRNAYLGIASLDDVASNFNMTPRSLQRRLQNESVTFQSIVDQTRKSLAIHYLRSGKYQIKEISHLLGYNELSAFSRAFKRWTGKPPITYQA